jgi:lipid-A-disaccharide synthase-like uncharacterized protein
MSRLSLWLLVGFLGQALFTARFVVQWLVSERKRDSVVPVAFWWLSLLGGGALLSYAISRKDPVIIFGQVMGLFVYIRNLMLMAQAKRHSIRFAPDDAINAPMTSQHSRTVRHAVQRHGRPGNPVASEAFSLSVPPCHNRSESNA